MELGSQDSHCVPAVTLLNVSTNTSVRPSRQSRRAPRGPRAVTLVFLVVLLIGGLTFVGVKLARHNESAPTQPSAQPTPPATSFAIPGCYNRVVPAAERPTKLNIVGCASVAVALQDMSWSS